MTKNLLLLHAALGCKQQLNPLKSLLEKEYTVYSLDFDGHGTNHSDTNFSIELFTKNVHAFILDNELESVHIFGYSMGGYVALNLAQKYPDLVGKIITFGTKFNWNPESAQREVKMLNPDVIETKVPKFAEVLSAFHGKENWKTVLKKTAQMMLELGSNPVHTSKSLNTVDHNVLITVGDQDNMVSIDESKWATDSLGNGELKILEGFVHPIERNDASRFITLINNSIQ